MRNLMNELVINQVLHAEFSRDVLDIRGAALRIRSLFPNEALSEKEIESMILEAAIARRVAVQLGPQQRE
jgi:hypothetical protein